MIGGIVEVAAAGRHLSVNRGFLTVTEDRTELGRVPLDDITALVLAGPQMTLSKQVMVALAERKAVIVVCGRDWHPLSMTLPLAAHFQSAGVLNDQIGASAPLKKRLWQRVVRAKIANQAAVLSHRAPDHPKIGDLAVLARRVRSGDPENLEAQAARQYWPALMGRNFRRDRHAAGSNGYLNYGYTVLRAATARAVCAAGLHPALGLHHGSRINEFALVDDLMEPYRPMVDSIVFELAREEPESDLTPDRKRRLAAVLQQDLNAETGASPLASCLATLARSLAASLAEKREMLALAELRQPGRLV